MPTVSQHQGKVEKNRRFLAKISVADDPEWAATVAFYIAVHCVEQLRAVAGHADHWSHTQRLQYVQHFLKPIHGPFTQLYNVSRLARYNTASDFFRQFSPDDVTERIIGGWLTAVESYTTTQLANPPSP